MIFSTNAGGFGRRTLAVAALLCLGVLPATADTIYLKNGTTESGIVDQNQSNEQFLALRKSTGNTIRINRTKIIRIEARENMSPQEQQGDLAAQDGDYDKALELYVRAAQADAESAELKKKVVDTREQIKKRDDQRFGMQFANIEKEIQGKRFQEAITMARQLALKAGEGSALKRCNALISAAYLGQARDSRNTVNYPKAEKAYRDAISAYPEGAVPQLELAELIQNYPTRQNEAFELYKQGIDSALKDSSLVEPQKLLGYRFNYAKLHFTNSKYREAAKLFWEVAQDDKRDDYAQSLDFVVKSCKALESELMAERPENDYLLEILKKIAEKRPTEEKAHFQLGKTYFIRSQYERALPDLEVALTNMLKIGSANIIDCRYYLGISYHKQGMLPKAVEQLRALLDIEPDRYEAICELGEIHYELADYGAALDQFQQGIQLQPRAYRAYLGAGRTLRHVDRYADAAVMYEELIKLRDENPDYYYELGLTYVATDRHEEAGKQFTKVLEILAKQDQEDKEVRAKLSDVNYHLGMSSLAMKRYNESIEQFDRALHYNKQLGAAIDGKGQALRDLGQLPEAEAAFQLAIQTDPSRPENWLNLGVLYHKYLKDTKRALDNYQQYYARGGKDPQVSQWIRECGGEPPTVTQ